MTRMPKESPNKENFKRIITCYKCNEEGHKSYECQNKFKKINGELNAIFSKDLSSSKDKEIKINGLKYKVLFDTGSSENFIHENIIKEMKIENQEKLKNKEKYLLINGTKLIVKSQAKLSVDYEGKTGGKF